MNPSPIFLPEDLITELLSFLPVKSLIRFKCVNNSWRTLISDSTFVKLHLKKSATQNPMFTLITHHMKFIPGVSLFVNYSVVPYPIRTLLDNPAVPLFDDPYYYVKNKGCSKVIASCNGLILLTGDFFNGIYKEFWFRLWNPATKTISKEIGCFNFEKPFRFGFGCDDSANTYKVVASRYIRKQRTTEVRILSLDDDVWRDIESFPVVPLYLDHAGYKIYGGAYDGMYSGVYLSGALNWLAIHNNIDYHRYIIKNITVEDFVIVSLDLRTEMFNQYLLPRGFDEVPPSEPTIGVLGGFLCFSYCYKKSDFVIWQMKKFGVEDSWTQLFKISYQNLQIDYDINDDTKFYFKLMPLLLSKDGDTLVLKSNKEYQAILYSWRDNRVERTKISRDGGICWQSFKGYAESLVPIY
ncbi:unnamed protein product [Lathyrus sativus]|nr:unnamed protein product [Lathyrus sativus]